MPAGPTDGREGLKLRPAEPMRTRRANICGIQAYLSRYELSGSCHLEDMGLNEEWSAPFVSMDIGNAEGGDQANAKSTDDAANGDAQASTIDS